MVAERRDPVMANALTGQVAVISDMRDGWEELADESCPVLIGKLVRKNGMECYHTDAPLLVRWPALATRHGTSWWWNADGLSAAQTTRALIGRQISRLVLHLFSHLGRGGRPPLLPPSTLLRWRNG